MTTSQNYDEYSNKTAYSIKSDAVRYTWAGYYLFVIASSVIGDTTILIASIKYKAIKLHRVIIAIIQHIAFFDLIVSVTYFLPKRTYLYFRKNYNIVLSWYRFCLVLIINRTNWKKFRFFFLLGVNSSLNRLTHLGTDPFIEIAQALFE